MTLAQLQTMRDALTAALGSPVLECVIDGVTVRYASAQDVEHRRAIVDADIAKQTTAAPPSYTYAQFSKDGRGNNNSRG
jgi:hypothetical protein